MYTRPAVLGIDTHSPDIAPKSDTEQMLRDLGNNTGNILFSESLYTVLPNAVRCSYGVQPEHIEGCDVIVIAAANWINPFDDFGFLADLIEQSNLPVIISGIGAQIHDNNHTPPLQPGTMRLLKLASERSKALSVRGQFSCEILAAYGITNVMPTGCPSLLLAGNMGPALHMRQPVDASTTALHATRHQFNDADAFQSYLYREAMRQQTDIIVQSELSDLFYVLDSAADEWQTTKSRQLAEQTYGQPADAVKQYLRGKGKALTTLDEWSDYLQIKQFCLGTRVHGTIASLIVGTPAVLIAHDTRTEEMAIQMGLPHVLEKDMNPGQPLDIRSYYDQGKFQAFTAHYPQYYSKFAEFFALNELPFDTEFSGLMAEKNKASDLQQAV